MLCMGSFESAHNPMKSRDFLSKNRECMGSFLAKREAGPLKRQKPLGFSDEVVLVVFPGDPVFMRALGTSLLIVLVGMT